MPVTVKLRGVQKEFDSKEAELFEFLNASMRARAFQALAELKRRTPVDTGRARNSWVLTQSPAEFRADLAPTGGVSTTLANAPSKTKIEQLYITNGVDYIDKLNSGSSKQAPARFIELSVLQFFEIDGIVFNEV